MDFTCTKKDWDKARPMLLKSTGLGDALTKYEKAKSDLSKYARVSDYSEATQALENVEKMRLAAIKECGTKFAEAKKYLESAKAERERGFLTAIFGNKLLSHADKVGPEIEKVVERYENRVKVLEIGLPQFKMNKETGHSIDPKIQESVKYLVTSDGGTKDVGKSTELEAVLEAAARAQVLKKNSALVSVVKKCEVVAAGMKNIPLLRAKSEQLVKGITPYVNQGAVEKK